MVRARLASAHFLEDASRLVALEYGLLAVVAKGRLTLDSGVLAVGADVNLPRSATFAPSPRSLL